MSADKLNEDKFDDILRHGLRRHSEEVPSDFAERMLRQIREAEEQRILARVVLQERLSLAGCIVLGVVTVAVVVVFPGIAAGFTEYVRATLGKATQIIEAVRYDWQFYAVFLGLFGFIAYSLVDLLVGDG
jgi:hypothetical protein